MADPVVTSHHAIAPHAEAGATVEMTIDGRAVVAGAGEFLIAAAERAGVFIPRFCYHPRLRSVGMCRMCLVEVSGPRGATLQPACYVAVAEGMEVVTTSEKVKKAQDGVLELLLVNHPLDCPVCDKGGECPLQDQVLAYGPGESRFLEEKRHWAKPTPISELVLLDRERCIQCGRCVRFANEVAGEAQIDFLGRGDAVEVNVFEGEAFSSYFSGNTVQICPVGALTATPYRFTARPWDLDQVESTCTLCAFGCRAAVQSSANRLTRLLGMDSDPVNQSWLCDKGRFASEAVNAESRLTEPLIRRNDVLEPASWAEALSLVASRLAEVRSGAGPAAIAMIGGARLTNEDAYAWAKLAKGVIGTDSVDAQLGDGLPAEVMAALPRATIDEACAARCLVVLAGDLREELPVLFLRVRGAAVENDLAVVELTPQSSALTGYATASLTYRPGQAAELVRALAGGGDDVGSGGADGPATVEPSVWAAAATALGRAGSDGDGVVVILGRPSLAEDGALVAEAAAAMAEAWPAARFLPALRRGNVMGAIDMGLAPGLLPGRVSLEDGRAWFEAHWGSVPTDTGRDAAGILTGLADGSMAALMMVGADPLSDFPDRTLAEEALEGAGFVVAVDGFLSASAARADVVLPASIVHERAGTTTNIEGRVTRLGQKLVAPGQCWPDWMIASELAARLGGELGLGSVTEIWDEIERLAASHRGITRSVLDAPTARDGIIAPLATSPVSLSRRLSPEPFDPMATPGIESVEAQGAPPRSGGAESSSAEAAAGHGAAGNGAGGNGAGGNGAGGNGAGGNGAGGAVTAPARLRWPQPVVAPSVPAVDSYSVRLVSGRRLYDGGVLVGVGEALAALVAPATVRAHPHDLEKLGVGAGDRVRLRTGRGDVVLAAALDERLPRGVVSIDFNLATDGLVADGRPAASVLIDSRQAVVDVRMETP
ncbi:MAG TPA: NADH-quinone oxidoreductase subunit NuoG [Acidimicrobiales bacterium]|nr:NADH-quinone oxidoreductase subunit NuoG [Acidimicrobiales bacterium]